MTLAGVGGRSGSKNEGLSSYWRGIASRFCGGPAGRRRRGGCGIGRAWLGSGCGGRRGAAVRPALSFCFWIFSSPCRSGCCWRSIEYSRRQIGRWAGKSGISKYFSSGAPVWSIGAALRNWWCQIPNPNPAPGKYRAALLFVINLLPTYLTGSSLAPSIRQSLALLCPYISHSMPVNNNKTTRA